MDAAYRRVMTAATMENNEEFILNKNYLGEVPLDAAADVKTNPC